MPTHAHSKIFKILISSVAISLFVFGISFSFALAEEASQTAATQSLVPQVVTQSLIPNSVSCETPVISSLKTYVYEGALHSLEFVVSDNSQVALSGSIGDTVVPFHHIQRTAVEGGVKMFITSQTKNVGRELPVSVTMLSSKGPGQPVCATTVSFKIVGDVSATSGSVSGKRETPDKIENPVERVTKSIGNIFTSLLGEDAVKSAGKKIEKTVKDVTGQEKELVQKGWRAGLTGLSKKGNGSIIEKSGMIAAVKGAATEVCTTKNGASRTWMLLLAVYILGALWLYSHGGRLLKDPLLLNAALLIPFIILLAFWYFVPECRVGWWTLGGSVVVAFVAVFGKFYLTLGEKRKKDNPWTVFHP